MKRIIPLLIILSSLAFPQQDPIVTDRPDITESALTVPKSSLQVETGFLIQNTRDEENNVTANFKDISFLSTLLRYGLFEEFELRLGSEYLYQKVEFQGTSSAEGLNGLLAGVKYQLLRDNSSLPDIALLLHLNIPLTGSEKFKPYDIESEVLIALSHALTKTFSLSYNLGSRKADNQLSFFYSISLAAPLSEKTGAFIEYFGETASSDQPGHNIDGGFTYLIQDNFQFDISAGISLDKPEDNWFLSTGISFRLPE